MQDIRITVDGRDIVVSRRRAGKAVYAEVRGQERRPTLAEVQAVLEATIAKGCPTVWWLLPEHFIPPRLSLRRCMCGESVIGGGRACTLCLALDPLTAIVEPYSLADEQARYEAAERMLERVAKVADELRRQVMTGRVSGSDPR